MGNINNENNCLEEISIEEDPNRILSNFHWSSIPKFAVIAGKNGSGKTRLLDAINLKMNNLRNDMYSHIKLALPSFVQGRLNAPEIKYVRYDQDLNTLMIKDESNPQGRANGGVQGVKSVIEYIRRPKAERTEAHYNKIIDRIEKNLERSIDASDEKTISNAIDPTDIQIINDGFNNAYIKKFFEYYYNRLTEFESQCFRQGKSCNTVPEAEIERQIGQAPWEIINALFDENGFHYHINTPNSGIDYQPAFFDISVKEGVREINFSDLSSGEKIIVALVLWSYNSNLGDHTKLFLLDEFDAHLNPSLSKMFIDIVKSILVDKFGMQVILTTHHPSTVAYVEDENLFWMERRGGGKKTIKQSSRGEIIPILSEGLVTVSFEEAELSLDYNLQQQRNPNPFLLVEGITDKLILEKAWGKLFDLREMPFFIQDYFDCGFIINTCMREEVFRNYKEKLFIALLDFDNAYKEFIKRGHLKKYDQIQDNAFPQKVYKNKKHLNYVTFLPVPSFRQDGYGGQDKVLPCLSIELLFEDALIENYCVRKEDTKLLSFNEDWKTKFAKTIVPGFDKSAFKAFKPLFETLLKILDDAQKN